jgi:general L-amino acid transport system substrate-binding protein
MSSKLVALVLATTLLCVGAAHADRLTTVKARGMVVCGSSSAGTPGFSATAAKGNWAGMGADYCRALAAAIFNDPSKVRFVTLDPANRIGAVVSGQVDALADLIPWTLSADTDDGVRFVGTLFYDGQGFLAPKAAALNSARDLGGKEVCVVAGGTEQDLVADYFDANNISAKLRAEVNETAAIADYVAGNCAALTSPISVLASIRAGLPTPGDNVLLPDLIDKEPLSIVIAQGDDRWFDIARWTFYALLDAEELGVTQTNVDEMLGSDNISVRRFLGVEDDFGAEIGLNKDWAYQIIKGAGNYGDIFDRNIGGQTPLRLPRGLNALWNKGGIQYSPPVR